MANCCVGYMTPKSCAIILRLYMVSTPLAHFRIILRQWSVLSWLDHHSEASALQFVSNYGHCTLCDPWIIGLHTICMQAWHCCRVARHFPSCVSWRAF